MLKKPVTMVSISRQYASYAFIHYGLPKKLHGIEENLARHSALTASAAFALSCALFNKPLFLSERKS